MEGEFSWFTVLNSFPRYSLGLTRSFGALGKKQDEIAVALAKEGQVYASLATGASVLTVFPEDEEKAKSMQPFTPKVSC